MNWRQRLVLGSMVGFLISCTTPTMHSSERAPSSKVTKKVLIPVPSTDFDPTEAAVPWELMKAAGFEVTFATVDGRPGSADPAEVTGVGLGLLAKYVAADENGKAAYAKLTASEEFTHPLTWSQVRESDYDAIYLPGGHSPGMQPYLHSEILQKLIADFFAADKPVGAICHGALLVARSTSPSTGKSVLYGRKTTSLTGFLEMTGYEVAKNSGAKNADHFRTDPITVEDQIKTFLASPNDYQEGPKSLLRDSPQDIGRGFFIQDRNYMSARWPGDAFRFGSQFAKFVTNYQPHVSPQVRYYYLPYRDHSMYVRIGEYLPRQQIRGDIFYLHGFADRVDNHAPLFEAWTQQGFRVIGFDMPAHGEDYGWGDLLNSFTIGGIEDLSRLVEKTTQEDAHRPLIMAGWSTGGLIAVRLMDPVQIGKLSRRPIAAVLFAPGVAVRSLVGDDGFVTQQTLTSNPKPPHEGPIKPKSPLLYPGFSMSLLYNAHLSQQVVKSLPRDIPMLTFVAGVKEDHYDVADKVRQWALNARDAGVPMSGVACEHSYHELDNEPAPVGPEVRDLAAMFVSEAVVKDPNLSGVSAKAQACRAF